MRHIIALLAGLPDPFIEETQKHFASAAKGYILSRSSLPHITLAQFTLKTKEVAFFKAYEHISDEDLNIVPPFTRNERLNAHFLQKELLPFCEKKFFCNRSVFRKSPDRQCFF